MFNPTEVVEALEGKIGESPPCMCGTNNWEIGKGWVVIPVMVQLGEYNGNAVPMVSLICNNCGNTLFFDYARLMSNSIVKAKR